MFSLLLFGVRRGRVFGGAGVWGVEVVVVGHVDSRSCGEP